MLIDIYIICLLFVIGLILGMVSIIIGIKGPLKNREYFNCCDNCNNLYKWYELIPIVSFFLMRGECNYCKKEISLVYPFLEIISGMLMAMSYMIYGFSYEMIIMIILTILSIIVYVSDFKYYIILDSPLLIFSIVVLILKYCFFGFKTFLVSLCSGFLIFLFMMIVRYIGSKIFGQESLGGGDVKLSMFFGFVLGIRLSIATLVIGSFLAFPCAIYYALSNKGREIPFGPFLITSLYLVFVFMEPINSFLLVVF